MDVRLWGPSAWETMHSITFTYPDKNPTEEEKEAMVRFFYSIADVLPCYRCRKHFKESLLTHSIEDNLQNRDQLTRWLVARHNDVNQRLDKPIVSYDFVKSKYDDYKNKCNYLDIKDGQKLSSKTEKIDSSNNKKIEMILVWILVGLIVILITCLIIYKCAHYGLYSNVTRASNLNNQNIIE